MAPELPDPSLRLSPAMPAPVALTGVPGTGKSSAAARLAPGLRSVEVGDLALAWRLARRSSSGAVSVDLGRLRQRFRRAPPDVDLVVGHLAHLLPLRDVVVLRCHPEVLLRRLRGARRGSRTDRQENYVAEALDLVLAEAIRPGRRVWEVDTTHRSPAEVGRIVRRFVRTRPPSRYGGVDWLADPRVTEHLLPREP
ncbi:MAG TPA: AAA family ATPase [Thermoplasmata archaeon]|nr:AAA family ATPase [Thermoplasmata archaeon]